MIDGNRHSGRTTLMLSKAYLSLVEGSPVVIVGATHREAKVLQDTFFSLYPNFRLIGRSPLFLSKYEVRNKTQGFSNETIIFWDHHAIETERAEYIENCANLKRQNKILRDRLNKISDYVNGLDSE